ncbi:hypothetical protein GCM10009839_60830 [Catenulispora yoronensis]|uniref:Uncharacterized protein n=1 Tax=Catenulispora yoronensis TaxID=450799 RepID=A0ABP5GJZ3_9ACTN
MNNSEPDPNPAEPAPDVPDSSDSSDSSDDFEATQESLERLSEHTAETLAEARQEVDKAMATSHDQIMPAADGGQDDDWEDDEGSPEKDDTRGAWPNWTKDK